MLAYKTIRNQNTDQWVIFIHGAGGSSKTWDKQIADFSRHFNLMLIDLRDHGESKNLEPYFERYNFDIITKDILKVIDHEGITKASFVSLSLGSIIMQNLMIQRPELIQRCVFAGAVIKGDWKLKLFVRSALLFNRFLTYEQMYRIFSWIVMPKKIHQRARRIYRLQARKLTQGEYLKWLGLYDEFFSLLRRFSDWSINYPTLLMMGQHDYVFLKSASRFSISQSMVSLSVLPGSGHICNIDDSVTFNKESIEFLLNK